MHQFNSTTFINVSFTILHSSLTEIVADLIKGSTVVDPDANVEKNLIDPYAAALESVLSGYTTQKEWELADFRRRNQKTMMNHLGDAQQRIIGTLPGWTSHRSGTGKPDVVGVRGDQRIIAEVKNKHNTMNYNSSRETYDELTRHLDSGEFRGFTAAVVTLISPTKTPLIRHFAPGGKPVRDDVLIMSGRVFYAFATDPNLRTPSVSLAESQDISRWTSWTAIDVISEAFFSEVEKQTGLTIPAWARALTKQAFN